MECLLAFLFLLGMAWFFLLVVSGKGPFSRQESPVQRAARRFHGRVTGHGWFRSGGLEFNYTDTVVSVLTGVSRRDGAYVEAWMDWPKHDFQMLIVPVARPLKKSAVRSLGTLDSATDTFFWRYRVYTNNAELARQLLTETIKWHVEQLRTAIAPSDIEIRWREGRLRIRKFASLRDAHSWEQFIGLALRIYDQSMLVIAEGIEFVESTDAVLLQDVRCQVCGETITTDMVFCRLCRTPHHRECWEYNGSCSVFACRETQYVTPRVAAPPK